MKLWMMPEAVAQTFVPNEYVSSCTMLLNCDLCADVAGPGKQYERVHIMGTMQGGAMDGQEVHASFYGCGAEYIETECGELSKLTVTHYRSSKEVEGAEKCGNHWLIPMETPVEAYFWEVGGRGHGTVADFELTKS